MSNLRTAANVVKLPTAAPRKVDNTRFAGQRQAARVARVETPWPGDHQFPYERRRAAEERTLGAIHRSPELLIVMTMLEMMAPEDQQRLTGKVEAYAAAIGDDISAAAAVITRKLAKGSAVAALEGGTL